MNNSEKISIIVAVYNTEKYVEKTLLSLLNQTYKNIEIVIIDDKSTDKSNKIIKKLMKQDNRIKLIENEKNSGLSYSRNLGLKNATGEYIGYIDSDDYVSENYYESLIKGMLKNNADLGICNMKIIYEFDNNKEILSSCCDAKCTKLGVINSGLAASACNKLFKKELISKYEFSVGKVNEDLAVVLPTIINAKKISYSDDCYYYYIQRNNSIQNSKFTTKRFDIFYGVDLTLKRIKGCKNYKRISDAIVFNQLWVLLIYAIPKEPNFIDRYKILSTYSKMIKKYNKKSKINKNRFYWDFIDGQGTKHKYYYKLLIKSNNMGLNLLSNLLILFYKFYVNNFIKSVINDNIEMDDLVKLSIKQSKMKSLDKTISVVMPNYNYSRFLYQRLYSILYQQVKIDEIIILDDCSKDDSRDMIDDMVEKLQQHINIRSVYNKTNSGSAFKQWQKGFDLAKSDYVWIAEADDYCDKTALKHMIKPILKDDNVVISYVDTAFIDTDGKIFLRTIKPEIDIMKTGHWNKSYINSGENEFKNYSFLNCTLANVSSAIIKKDNYDNFFKLSGKFKQAGDWLLYVNIMHKGNIAFYNKPLNYYRVHGNNVSSVTKKESHIKEIIRIHNYYRKTYGLNKKQEKEIQKRYEFLKEVWGLK